MAQKKSAATSRPRQVLPPAIARLPNMPPEITYRQDRTQKQATPSGAELATNLVSNWLPELKGMGKALWKAVRHPIETAKDAGNSWITSSMIADGWEHEKTGKWPKSWATTVLPPDVLKAYQQQAQQVYHQAAQQFTYVDPQTGRRHFDENAMLRMASKDPVGIGATVLTLGGEGAGMLANTLSKVKDAAEASGSFRGAKLASGATTAAKTAQLGLKGAANVANPIPLAVSLASQTPVVKGAVKLFSKNNLYDSSGALTPEGQRAMARAGLDPADYQDDVSREILNRTVAQDGLSPQALKKAAVRVATIPENATKEDILGAMKFSPTRSMIEQTQFPEGRLGARSAERQRTLSGMIAGQEALARQSASDIGAQISRSVGQNEAYIQDPVSHGLVSGMRDHINAELAANGMPSLEYMAAHPGAYPDVSKMLLKGQDAALPSLSRWEAGTIPAPSSTPVTIKTPMGEFTKVNGEWMGASGAVPASQTGVIQFLEGEAARVAPPAPHVPVEMPTPRSILDTFNPGEGKGKDAGIAYQIRNAAENYLSRNLPAEGAEALAAHQAGREAFSFGFGNEAQAPAAIQTRASQLARARNIVEAPTQASAPSPYSSEASPGFLKNAAVNVAGFLGAKTHPWLAAPATHLADRLTTPNIAGGELAPKFNVYPGMTGTQTDLLRVGMAPLATPPAEQRQQASAPQVIAPRPQPTPGTSWVDQQLGSRTQAPAPSAPSAAGIGYEDIWGKPTAAAPQAQPPRREQRPAIQPSEPEQETKPEDYVFAEGQWRGGRTAYKKGGKVEADIEPLIQALMNKAKKAKKVSNKATEPLLNAHDDAIASALATAQKAI